MDHPGGGFAASPWAAVLGHHAMSSTGEHHGFTAHAHSAAHHAHHGMPMDLHVPQGFPYYRYEYILLYFYTLPKTFIIF